MNGKTYNVLFLCTGNTARSILAESLLNARGAGRFHAYSAGSFPKGEVRPEALRLLRSVDLPTEGLRSKSWDEFAALGAPHMDFVITVCDQAAGEVCPIWPGKPITAHWGIPDPAAATGSDAEVAVAFCDALKMLERHVSAFLALPLEKLDAIAIKRRMDEIGGPREVAA
jgi:arsenate reductase